MKIKEFIIMPQTIKPMGLIHKPGTGPNNRFGFKNSGNNRANEDGDSVARLLGKAEASLSHGLQMAQNVIKKDYGIAEVQAKVIAENWPPLINNIKNVYKTAEDAAGVGIVTKQNATKDVPIGGQYMNVKKLGLAK
jgi:hypothetical protein|tara:strand:- start:413 stop:820 length:408 start_codon:yes stop_codon:yes gene_type:complete